jgi:hypothetical protein
LDLKAVAAWSLPFIDSKGKARSNFTGSPAFGLRPTSMAAGDRLEKKEGGRELWPAALYLKQR